MFSLILSGFEKNSFTTFFKGRVIEVDENGGMEWGRKLEKPEFKKRKAPPGGDAFPKNQLSSFGSA